VDVDLRVDMPLQKHPIIDRRTAVPEQSIWWSKLLAQNFSNSSLGKFGYELIVIRIDEGHSLAELRSDSGIAVITESGEINTSPNIKIG
jgi:hypothetical protein